MIVGGIIAPVVMVRFLSLAKSAGMADRKLEEIHRLAAAREAGGLDGN